MSPDLQQVPPAPQMTKEEGMLDLTLPAEMLHNQVRVRWFWHVHAASQSTCRSIGHSVTTSDES